MPILENLLLSGFDYSVTEKKRILPTNLLGKNRIENVRDFDENKNQFNFFADDVLLIDFSDNESIYSKVEKKLKISFDDNLISANVYKTSFNLINEIPESVLFLLDFDNIYPTKYGTLVLDWGIENSTDEFSLEIGNECFGYFYELNGKDIANVQEVKFNYKEVNNLYTKIEDFYKKH